MLADRRSEAFVTNFTGQLLNLRKLPDATPDLKRFPDFDGTLRRETELFFESIQREDRSVLELLTAEHTFVSIRPRELSVGCPGSSGRRQAPARPALCAGGSSLDSPSLQPVLQQPARFLLTNRIIAGKKRSLVILTLFQSISSFPM